MVSEWVRGREEKYSTRVSDALIANKNVTRHMSVLHTAKGAVHLMRHTWLLFSFNLFVY